MGYTVVMRRKVVFAPGEYYHLMVRGNNKQDIFCNDADRSRFLFLTTHLVAPVELKNISRSAAAFAGDQSWRVDEDQFSIIRNQRYISLIAFAFMPNHAHWLVLENEEGGVSRYMQRVLNAYTKYFNKKHANVGHLFQGPFKAVHIHFNTQLLHVSAYIHKNPSELKGMRGREDHYEWSSYRDYLGDRRLDGLLDPSPILGQFNSLERYRHYVRTNPAKELLP